MSQTEELAYNDASSINDPDDVELPKFAHHLKIRSELEKLMQLDVLTGDEADDLYEEWRKDRQ